MISVSKEALAWVADQLGLALVAEQADGAITGNTAALAASGGELPADLESAIRRVADLSAEVDVAEMIAAAKRGQLQAFRGEPTKRVLILPNEGGTAAALIAGSRQGVLAESVQERAAASDLAAGVSHEVSNALSAIIGFAQLAMERPDKAPPEEALALIERSAQTARGATQDLLRAVRRQDVEVGRTDLSVVIQDAVRLLRPEAQKRRVSVRDETQPGCWVQSTRSQLFSIVWNLAHNAVQMVPADGEVSLACRQRGPLIELEVRDNGPGMSSEQKDKAFDPYFTTRSEGTGLGLAIVRDTVEALEGRIRLDTSPGYGTQFRIQLPAAGRHADSGQLPRPTRISKVMEETSTEGVHVLVVEDDAGVRDLIATTLSLCNIDATCVESATEARALDQNFDVVLLDLTLTDQRGDILLAALRDAGRCKRAAIMSGGPPPDNLDEAGRPDRWLRKPFEPADLVMCVRDLLEGKAASVMPRPNLTLVE